ncbi:MAG: MBL fold metallo-hydrolase [Anaerovoracaceae bacterium]
MERIYPLCFDEKRRKKDDKNNEFESIGSAACRRAALPLLLLVFAVMILLSSCSAGSAAGEMDYGNDAGTYLPAEDDLTAYFLDVGQADATLLVSQGEAMLIDAGNRDDAQFIIGYLDELGIDRLKYVVFTHPHEDHIGSGEVIISQVTVDKVYMLDGYDEGLEGSLKRTVQRMGISAEAPDPGDTTYLGECSIEFLGPISGSDDENDMSICLRVDHGRNSMLFTGDAGSGPEREMIESGAALEADLLQAGHHGSSTSNSYYFLREVNPRYVVISCGKDNMYGHPHEETLSRFNDLGAEVFRTDLQGTVIAVDDGENITFNCEGEKADRPYSEDYQEASYIGNVNSKKYHSPDCGGLPKEENRVYFTDADAAEKAGYQPCGLCHPDEAR